jgi:hypothetical protein
MRTAPRVSPHRHAGDRLRRHPPGVAPLGLSIHFGAAEWHWDCGDQSAVETLRESSHNASKATESNNSNHESPKVRKPEKTTTAKRSGKINSS